jgi:signal transduction histidine kinase
VERHMGDVAVESEPGRTSFEIRLPPVDAAAAP